MNTLSERQQNLLESVISEYIRIAEPISSQYLEERYDFGVSPATIRNELQVLSEGRYLEQPHISAGRIPTDKGYRFFVDEILQERNVEEEGFLCEGPFQLTRRLNSLTSALAALYIPSQHMFFKEGWESVLAEPEFVHGGTLRNFARFIKDFEEYLAELHAGFAMDVFIGRENPFSRVQDFSIMIAECDLGDTKGIAALVGPKRMAYKRNIKALKRVWNRKKQPNNQQKS